MEALEREIRTRADVPLTRESVEDQLRDQMSGRFCPVIKKLIVTIFEVNDWSQSVVDASGDLLTTVRFMAIVFRAVKDEVAKGVVASAEVLSVGLKSVLSIRAGLPPLTVKISEELVDDPDGIVVPEKGSVVTYRCIGYKVLVAEGHNGCDMIVVEARRVY